MNTMNQKPVQGFDPDTCRSLYVGNIDHKVTEPLLYEIFGAVGNVENVKIIKDKATGASLGYGFVDYFVHGDAMKALNQLNGCEIYNAEIRVNWAFAGSGTREDTSSHHHVFVGDLSPEIDDRALQEAFSAFGSLSDARVMWDQNTGRSRGYGFVAFRSKEDADHSISDMNGVWLGTRAIRVNWANQKVAPKVASKPSPLEYDNVLTQSSNTNSTVYVGNLAPEVTDKDLRHLFSEFGYIEEIRIQDKGYAFIRFLTHDNAANAIVNCHGVTLGTRPIRCSWGKERFNSPDSPTGAGMGGAPMQQPMQQQFGYGMPHNNGYGYPAPPPQYGVPPHFMQQQGNPYGHPGSQYGMPYGFSSPQYQGYH